MGLCHPEDLKKKSVLLIMGSTSIQKLNTARQLQLIEKNKERQRTRSRVFHPTAFVRLASGVFYETIALLILYEIIRLYPIKYSEWNR